MNQNDPSKGETLCKECGLCCQGIFHPYANLKNKADKKFANDFHAIIKQYNSLEDEVFLLPCPAFTSLCSVYPNRPSVCQKHQCNLLKSVFSDEIDLEKALDIVNTTKDTVNEILPVLHEYSNDYFYNKPELLMDKIFGKYTTDTERRFFKEKNINLFLKYALFLMYRKKYFYT